MASSELRQYDFSKYKVLAIDDNEDSLLLLVEIFKHCGADVIGVRDTFKAREALQRVWPDIIVTDINLPRETGLEFAEWVHAHHPDRARSTPIIAITATSPIVRITRPPVIDALIHKPIVLEEVCQLVETLLRERRRGDR